MWKKIILSAAGGLILISAPFLNGAETITAWRDGERNLLIRSTFSERKDLVISITRFGNDSAWMIERNTPLLDYRKGEQIHVGGDEYGTTHLGNFGVLGGNHGSPFASVLLIPGHGLTAKDLGGEIMDNNRYPYIITGIPDKDRIMIHPLGTPDTVNPGFRRHKDAPLSYQGKNLAFRESRFAQMFPLNRITDYRILTDGENPLQNKRETQCVFLDLIMTHDIVSPYGVVSWMKEHPGKNLSPAVQDKWTMMLGNTEDLRAAHSEYMKLPALATIRNRFRFEAGGGCVINRKIVYHVPLSRVNSLDVMFSWNGTMALKPRQEFYIPKLKPVILKGVQKTPDLPCDFSAVCRMPRVLNASGMIGINDFLDPENVPDRFIRIVGTEGRELGIALGYSLFLGDQVKLRRSSAGFRNLFFFWKTQKMYPYAYELKNAAAGTALETVAYRQYFNPAKEPDATAFYGHHQGNSLVVYLDFHKTLNGKKVSLPSSAAGKTVTILEKTPSVTLHGGKYVGADGCIMLDVRENYGYIVLKLD